MSLNIPKVQAIRVVDPRLEINREREYVALKGAQSMTWQVFPTNNINNSTIVISANPPSRKIVIDRHIIKRAKFQITIPGTNTSGSTLLQPGYVAPRCMPLLSCTNAETVNINNDTVTQSPMYQYWSQMLWYHNDFLQRYGKNSISPAMLDQSLEYADAVNTVRNPLSSSYFDNSYEQTRGSFNGFNIITNPTVNGQSAVVELTVEEPIFLSPLLFDRYNQYGCGLVGIENFTYSCTFFNLPRLLSLVQNQGLPGLISINLAGITVDVQEFSLNFNYLTPDSLTPIPRQMTSSYYNIISYPTRFGQSVASGASATITMQSIQLASIPRKIYIYVRKDDGDLNASTTDTCFPLVTTANPLTMTWNNNVYFSTATTSQLYQLSVRNGLSMSYPQFLADKNGVGSVICLESGIDIPLMADESAGLLEKIQLSLTVQVKNPYAYSVSPTLFVVCVYEGVFNMIDGQTNHMLGVLSRSDVLNSVRDPLINFKKSETVFGGDFFSSLKRGLSSVHDFMKKAKPVSNISGLIPDSRAQAISRAAKSLGYGISGGGK